MEKGWAERTNRLAKIIKQEKENGSYRNIVFAYPISHNLYQEWKFLEDKDTSFVNITLAPKLEVCLQNRGARELDDWEITRIKQMYQEGYQNPPFSDLIIDNGSQTPQETVQAIVSFLQKQDYWAK